MKKKGITLTKTIFCKGCDNPIKIYIFVHPNGMGRQVFSCETCYESGVYNVEFDARLLPDDN